MPTYLFLSAEGILRRVDCSLRVEGFPCGGVYFFFLKKVVS